MKKDFIPTYQRFFDPQAQVPFLFNASTRIWISYDDEQSIRLKAEYVHVRHLRGVSFWDLNGDRHGQLISVVTNFLRNTSYSLPSIGF